MLSQGKLAELREELCEMNVVDIAQAMESLPSEELLRVFRILPKDISADVFSYLESDSQTQLVSLITDSELENLLDEMFLDDTVDFLEEVPAGVVRRVLKKADSETRKIINRFLKYPENSAGSIMTIEMVELHDHLTVGQAIESIRATAVDKETVYTCLCIDEKRHLIGTVALHSLLVCKDDELISDVMDTDSQLIFVNTLDDQEQVADMARKYDLLSVPVVDNEGRLVGIITIDDIVDVIEEENTEDFEKMAMLRPSEDNYLKTGVLSLAKNRIIWLLVLMVSATFTGKIIENYESMLAAVAGLTAAIPMLMGTSGNAGNQVSTLIIRGLALGELSPKDYFKILFKELRVALICGVILAAVNMLRMFLFSSGGTYVALVVSGSILCAVTVSKIIGCTLPIVAKLIKLDPALMAGSMITTIMDMITLAIYFALANAFLL
ncbi:MAG: magnesium transporter [Clostridia bacterium]|nr:magnesium transporter [Clostridia bacterium]